MSFLSQQKTKNPLGLTHTMTNRDKRPHINIHCLVPAQSRLLNDSDNKNSMSCLCYGQRNIPSGLRDVDVISFELDCCEWDLLLTRGHSREHSDDANCNHSTERVKKKDGSPHNHTSRICLASRCHEQAAISSQSPSNCTAARQNEADLHHA